MEDNMFSKEIIYKHDERGNLVATKIIADPHVIDLEAKSMAKEVATSTYKSVFSMIHQICKDKESLSLFYNRDPGAFEIADVIEVFKRLGFSSELNELREKRREEKKKIKEKAQEAKKLREVEQKNAGSDLSWVMN